MATDMNTKDMRGSARVRNRIIASLMAEAPAIHTRIRQQWNQTLEDFPLIDNYAEGEPRSFANNQAHALCVINVGSTGNFQVVDIDDSGAEEVLARYSVRVYTYVKTASTEDERSYDRVVRLRDMTTALVRASILSKVSFGTEDMRLVHSTLTEQYSDFTKVKGNRWVGAVYHGFDVEVEEQLVRPLLGSAEYVKATLDITKGTQNV